MSVIEGGLMASELYLCIGTLSQTPYFLSGLGINIYSMDELCYYLANNAYILDNDLIDLRLCDFIRNNLSMPELAEKLKAMLRHNKTLGEMVTTILIDTDYCTDEEIKKIRQVLVDNASLSRAAKRKLRGDNLLRAKKYPRAIEEYQYVLSNLDKSEESELYSSILHNIGCAYARMFLVKKAKEYFRQAYETDENRQSLVEYLVCLRLTGKKEEYDRIVVKNGYDERASLEALRILMTQKEAAPDGELADDLKAIEELKAKGDVSGYYGKIEETLEEWKRDYRRSMK